MIRKLSASLMALALAGCVNLAPDHERPALASAPAYDPEFRPDGTVVASTLSYREWFSDPRLVSLIDTAVANNRDLVAATAFVSPVPMAALREHVGTVGYGFDSAALRRAAELKAGPRVGPSPATVLDMQ